MYFPWENVLQEKTKSRTMPLRNGNGHSEKLQVYCKTLRGVELKNNKWVSGNC